MCLTSNLVLSTPGGSLLRPLWVTISISYGYIWREMRFDHILVTLYIYIICVFDSLDTENRPTDINGSLKGECSPHKQPPKFSLQYRLQRRCRTEFCIRWMQCLEATWMWVNAWHDVRIEHQSMKTLEGLVRSASPSVPEY